MYKRLLKEEAYHEGKYEEALKATFIGTDEDLRAGMFRCKIFSDLYLYASVTDPAHERDPSGCTAVAALITHDRRIFLVCTC